MCEHGDDVYLLVNVATNMSHTGESRWEEKAIDRCIAPIVKALNDAGVLTAGCCCGHGKTIGDIVLQDGRVLYLSDPSLGKLPLRETADFAPAKLSTPAINVLRDYGIDTADALLALDVGRDTVRWRNCGRVMRAQLRAAQYIIRESRGLHS